MEHQAVVQRALDMLVGRIAGYPCTSFNSLPGGKTLHGMVNSAIWINYDPSGKDWGWCIPGSYPDDIVVTGLACRMGRWSLLGTFVHELAHLNGADGFSHAAEETLRGCGLQSPNGPYDPGIRG